MSSARLFQHHIINPTRLQVKHDILDFAKLLVVLIPDLHADEISGFVNCRRGLVLIRHNGAALAGCHAAVALRPQVSRRGETECDHGHARKNDWFCFHTAPFLRFACISGQPPDTHGAHNSI